MARRPLSERQPPQNAPGMYISLWASRDDLEQIDELVERWGLAGNRSQAIKQAVAVAVRGNAPPQSGAPRRETE